MRGVGAERVLTDLVSLVRHAVGLDNELVPYPELVRSATRIGWPPTRCGGRLSARSSAGGWTASPRPSA